MYHNLFKANKCAYTSANLKTNKLTNEESKRKNTHNNIICFFHHESNMAYLFTLMFLQPTPLPTPLPIATTTTTTTSTTTTAAATTTTTTTSATTTAAATTTTTTTEGELQATFDSDFHAPRCVSAGVSCSSGALLNGRGFMMDGAELNVANTIDDCAFDGNSGTHKKDESLEAIKISSIDGGLLTAGKTAEITASVFAWSTGASDTADFYYTSDASNVDWLYIGSVTPSGGGEQDVKITYTLPQGTTQAVRVQFRFGGTVTTCTYGSYNDRDDLVFTVSSAPGQPTRSPVNTPPPSESQVGLAAYDANIGAPRCSQHGSKCDSFDLLNGRGLMKDGNEQNAPNTLDACTDGNSGKYLRDEYIERILVRSGDIFDSDSNNDMEEGGRVTIIAWCHPWRSGFSDYADFYYASDASNPQWVLIDTIQPHGSGLQELKISYILPQGTNQVGYFWCPSYNAYNGIQIVS